MTAYATRAQLYRHGLPAAALASQPRQVESIDLATNRLVVRGHGLATDDELRVYAIAGGPLVAPLVTTSSYFARVVDDDTIELAATSGGSVLDLTGEELGVHYVQELAGPRLDALLESWSRHVDQNLRAHAVPLTSVPDGIMMLVCRLAARAALLTRGASSPFYAEAISALEGQRKADDDYLAALRRGLPLLGDVDETPTAAENGARIDFAADAGTVTA